MNDSPQTTVIESVAGHWFLRDLIEDVATGEAADLPWLCRAADRVRQNPDKFLSWLEETFLDDDAAAHDAAGRSYWHPNGFAKLVLHTAAESRFRVRLHIWPASKEASQGESNPHSHRWEFASVVLAGKGMHMFEYRETIGGGKPYQRYRYGTDPADPAALVRDGQVRLRKTSSPHVQRGEVYSCDTEVVHTVRPIAADLTATVVVQGPRRVRSTVVYCEPGQTEDQPNRAVTDTEFKELLRSVIAAFGRA
ncbi:hypothetical protein [Amycolatopsis sp. H20-H5]|uniref:hypothetical protein n=1 Tax=Amycolatopsis sp. H20-H5 TaxID=3046309 RepID=UPI002DB9BD58|nr:hypothetical protein [Amycolatopsis sp. H20-H5]MEC3980796.1 hypothetical protein [Amycolatopsis sp. H20-H5]